MPDALRALEARAPEAHSGLALKGGADAVVLEGDPSLHEPPPTVHKVVEGGAHHPTARNPVEEAAVVRASGNATGRHDSLHGLVRHKELAASPAVQEEAGEGRLERAPTLPDPATATLG